MPTPHTDAPASPWVARFAPLLPAGGTVLDLACGAGRHARLFLAHGARVTCVDRDLSGVADLSGRAELIEADLEDGRPWPLTGRVFDAVVVVNYLYRPLLPTLVGAVAAGGMLIYETFALGNERFGRPRNPDFLLRPGELLAAAADRLQVVAYEAGIEQRPGGPAVVQRLSAFHDSQPIPLPPPPDLQPERG